MAEALIPFLNYLHGGAVFWGMIGIMSLLLIIKSANNALSSIMRFAEETKINYYFIGLFVISIGTSLPEIFTSLIASLEGDPALVLGDAMGATILDLTLVLGVTLIFARKIILEKTEINISPVKILFVVCLPLLLGFDGLLGRMDGIVMISFFLIYYGYNFINEFRSSKTKRAVSLGFVGKETVIFSISLAMLIFGVQLMVLAARTLAEIWGIPSYVFGVLILGFATTFPELLIELRAIKEKKSTPLAFGDIFGSVVCNMSLVIGIAVLIRPIVIEFFQFYSAGAFILLSAAFSMWALKRKEIGWIIGIGLVSIYLVFIISEVYKLMQTG